MLTRIIIIGQALPAIQQNLPYDSTMLWEWFEEIGLSQEQALSIFSFDAVYNQFPGFKDGGHATPTKEQMDGYWPELKAKIDKHEKIILLGNVAQNYILEKDLNKPTLLLMHPSYRNKGRFNSKKTYWLNLLKNFI